MIQTNELAPGMSISPVLTGLWQIADMERGDRQLDLSAAARAMAPYHDAGLTTFDMADHYGSAELIAGQFRQSLPPDAQKNIRLFTKWVPEPGPLTKATVREAVTRSLNRLQVERLDLLQFHAWTYADPIWLDALFWLQELKEEGLIGHLGLTNFDTAHLRMAVKSGIDIVSNQVCYSLLDQRAKGEMSRFCLENDVKLLAFGTVAGGFLTERWLGKPEPDWENLDTWSQMKYGRYIGAVGGWERFQALLQQVNEVAERHSVSMANIACRFILQQPAVAGVIIGARLGQSQHIADNLRLQQLTLSSEDITQIETVLADLEPIPGDCGDEYRKPPFLTASGDLSHHLDHFPAPYPTETDEAGRRRVMTGTTWESLAGYCRAVRSGNRIVISGSTATHGERLIGGTDPRAQADFILDKIEGVLHSLGAKLEDVIRTRIYVKHIDDWEPVARAHGDRFRHNPPANTLVQADLVGDGYLVEIEAEAEANDE